MNGIVTILSVLTQDQKQEFLLQLRRKNRRADTKNEKLFKFLDAGETDDLDIRLYGKPARNSYHALCKRLRDGLIDFVASKSFTGETSEELEILKLLLASRIFFEKKVFKLAFKTLENAERMAIPLGLYSILNEIYHTKIQYAHLNNNWLLEDIIETSETNMKLFQQDFHLNRAYAVIKSKLKKNEDSVKNVVQNTFSDFGIIVNETLTYKSLFQLMEITASTAKLQSDFHTISPFVFELYDLINKKRRLKDKHRFYHLSILNLLAITQFRNKRFTESMAFVAEMEHELQRDNSYNNRFSEKLLTLKALNYNYTGEPHKAIELLRAFKKDSLDIKLLIAMCLFQQEKFSEAYQIIKGLSHSDAWYEKKKGWVWVVKKSLIEILLLTELDRLDLVLLRLQQFKRKFSKLLQDRGEERVLTFVKLINKYYENPEYAVTSTFKDEVEKSFVWLGAAREDIFVMSFYAWLKSKMENKNLYEVTLKLVGQF
jgi:tetratricopeptide (TPR) repeat protein